MRDFEFERLKAQGTKPEPYTLYNKEQNVEDMTQKNETLRDFEYFHSMYPARMKGLQLLVEEVCDEMDYRGSPMYDEYPDRIMVEQLCRKVGVQATNTPTEKVSGAEALPKEKEKTEIYEATEQAVKNDNMPRMPYGPEYILQSVSPDTGSYQTWEMEDGQIQTTQATQTQTRQMDTERMEPEQMRPEQQEEQSRADYLKET